jgi:hypothetical protein
VKTVAETPKTEREAAPEVDLKNLFGDDETTTDETTDEAPAN